MRKARLYSRTGFYHVVIRGVNKQNIFFDSDDRRFFLSLLKKYGHKTNIKIHAFCLMDNHVHLEIEDPQKHISLFMQGVCSVYARVFNRKYDRIGHLFQSRFASEIIKNKRQFLAVFRYIMQNPVKAGMCNSFDYDWSSFKLYKNDSSFVEKTLINDLLKNENEMMTFLTMESSKKYLEIELRPSEKLENTIKMIKKLLKSEKTLIPPDLPHNEIVNKIRRLKRAKLSIRTISRYTGIPINIVKIA